MSDARRRLLRDLALRLDKSSLTVTDECLRFRFEESADLVALMASHGELGYDDLLALVRDVLSGRRPVDDAAAALDPDGLTSLMRLMAGLHMGERLMTGDFEEAADIVEVARMIQGDATFGPTVTRVEGQVHLATGRFDHVERMLADDDLHPDTALMLAIELEHPVNGRPGASVDAWLRAFNRTFEQFGALPITLADGPGTEFDRVRVDVPPDRFIDDGPLVTVVMSAYRPGPSIRTAVRSLIDQTWRNLEILVVDDCSPPEFDDLLAEVGAMDPRITVTRMPVNGGTYRIRNEAIGRSRGEFIAFQDSDDWAHPERIARQVAPLLEPRGLVATHCRGIRVFPNLSTLNVGLNAFRRTESSTVFGKDVVIGTLGGFDETRKSADNEFYERIGVVFGHEAYLNLPDVLTMPQLTAESLSRQELRFAWQHGARSAYVQAREHWHREITAGRASPRLEPGGGRRIYAPQRILTGVDPEPDSCDVLWISDWRAGFSRYVGQSELVTATIGAGLTTLAAQTTAVRNAHRDRLPLDDGILALQAAGKTRIVVWTDRTHARLAVVTDPELLNLTRPPESVGITVERLVVAAPHPPAAPSGDWLTYDPLVVQDNALRMFGVAPRWLPATSVIADALRASGAQDVLEPGLLQVAPPIHERTYRGARGAGGLIVGSGGHEPRRRDRPARKTLLERLPNSADFDVRVQVDHRHPNRISTWKKMPASWITVDDEVPFDRFVHQVDVFAVLPTRSWGPSLHWTALAALAEGAVVLADPQSEPFLGDAAIYADPGRAAEVLKPLVADDASIDAQRERGYAFCRARASSDAVASLIGRLVPGGEDAQ